MTTTTTETSKQSHIAVRNPWGPGTRGNATVSTDGTVRCYDSVAGHWTRCHQLTEAQQRWVRGRCRPGAICQ